MSITHLFDEKDVEKSGLSEDTQSFLPPSHRSSLLDLHVDHYFVGPRDISHHSKFPSYMRLHGSVLPKMIIPLSFVAIWSGTIVAISIKAYDVSLDSILITVLGILVAFATNLRCTTAYERYNDGRKYWAQLLLCSRNVARMIWLNIDEKKDAVNETLLEKISAINLISTFAIALKHRLRFEPAVDYPDLKVPIMHLNGITARKSNQAQLHARPQTLSQRLGEWLGISFWRSNPREVLKRTSENLGNVPHEILLHLNTYINKAVKDEAFNPFPVVGLCMTNLAAMTEVLSGCERILNTPLPLAYQICLSQIMWAYILLLPFELVGKIGWKAIPITLLATYVILGLNIIGQEIENPFGHDVNDLPLETLCAEIGADLDVIMATAPSEYGKFTTDSKNLPLYPLDRANVDDWSQRSEDDIRHALKAKVLRRSGWSSIHR